MTKEFDPGKAADWSISASKTPLDDRIPTAAGVLIHPQRVACVGIHPAYFEVELLTLSAVDRTVLNEC